MWPCPLTTPSQYAIVIDDKNHDPLFTNVAIGAWYESAMRYVYTHGIMQGMSEDGILSQHQLDQGEGCKYPDAV